QRLRRSARQSKDPEQSRNDQLGGHTHPPTSHVTALTSPQLRVRMEPPRVSANTYAFAKVSLTTYLHSQRNPAWPKQNDAQLFGRVKICFPFSERFKSSALRACDGADGGGGAHPAERGHAPGASAGAERSRRAARSSLAAPSEPKQETDPA